MTQNLADVRGAAAVRTVPLTRGQIFEIAAGAFVNRQNERFSTLNRIEHDSDYDNAPTEGTLLQPVVNALNAAGVATPATVGGVLRSLGVSFDALHRETCDCLNDGKVTSQRAAANFRRLGGQA